MKQFIGTKVIAGQPMTLGEYNAYRGWDMPKDEDPNKEGFLVEYLDSPDKNHPNHDHYISWSPKHTFDNAYRLTDGMNFGLAIEAAKKGLKIARKGWNGKGIFVFRHLAFAGLDDFLAIDTTGLQTDNESAPKSIVPWLASQTDMLADDWMVVE